MTISLGQIFLVLFICFLLFGNFSSILDNLTVFVLKFKDFINNNEKNNNNL